jgi:hypothetical protein
VVSWRILSTCVRYGWLRTTLCARSSGQSNIRGGLVSEYWEADFGVRGAVSTTWIKAMQGIKRI